MTTTTQTLLRTGLCIIGVLLLVTFLIPKTHHATRALKHYSSVPPFSLTERSGRIITNDDLQGKIWVVDFVFAGCPGPCPVLSTNMARLQHELAGDSRVQFVSITVNPQDDTPAVLTEYAQRFRADPNKWWFLTGPEKPVYDLVQKGFFQPVQDNHGKILEPGEFLVTHSTYMALVDRQGSIRGFYKGLNEDGQTSLLGDIRILEEE